MASEERSGDGQDNIKLSARDSFQQERHLRRFLTSFRHSLPAVGPSTTGLLLGHHSVPKQGPTDANSEPT
jgi:hypothetical protein